jgi:hypothetical protein
MSRHHHPLVGRNPHPASWSTASRTAASIWRTAQMVAVSGSGTTMKPARSAGDSVLLNVNADPMVSTPREAAVAIHPAAPRVSPTKVGGGGAHHRQRLRCAHAAGPKIIGVPRLREPPGSGATAAAGRLLCMIWCIAMALRSRTRWARTARAPRIVSVRKSGSARSSWSIATELAICSGVESAPTASTSPSITRATGEEASSGPRRPPRHRRPACRRQAPPPRHLRVPARQRSLARWCRTCL